MIRNAAVAQVYWLLNLTGIFVILRVNFYSLLVGMWEKIEFAFNLLHWMFVLHNNWFCFIIAGGTAEDSRAKI